MNKADFLDMLADKAKANGPKRSDDDNRVIDPLDQMIDTLRPQFEESIKKTLVAEGMGDMIDQPESFDRAVTMGITESLMRMLARRSTMAAYSEMFNDGKVPFDGANRMHVRGVNQLRSIQTDSLTKNIRAGIEIAYADEGVAEKVIAAAVGYARQHREKAD